MVYNLGYIQYVYVTCIMHAQLDYVWSAYVLAPTVYYTASTLYISLFYIHLVRLFVGFPCVISMFYKKHLENISPSVTLGLIDIPKHSQKCTKTFNINISSKFILQVKVSLQSSASYCISIPEMLYEIPIKQIIS
jgi:hypothetical protein